MGNFTQYFVLTFYFLVLNKRVFFWCLFFPLFWSKCIYAQIGELDRYDCNFTKEILVPFNYSSANSIVKPVLNQVVFYSYRDQFTYWYKVTAMQNLKIKINVSAINDSDSYAIYMYQYNQNDFCSKLYYQKLKPLISPWFVGLNEAESKNNFTEIDLKQGNTYYISVLNSSINYCGHLLKMISLNDTLTIKAFHTPCKKDLASIDIKKKQNDLKPSRLDTLKKPVSAYSPTVITKVVKKDSSIVIKNSKSNKFVCSVRNGKTKNFMDVNLTLMDNDTKDFVPVQNNTVGLWFSNITDVSKQYKLKCVALGYKDYIIQIENNFNDTIKVFMEPISVGENFIMKSIYFHPNTYALRKESSKELSYLLNYLIDNPMVSIEIQGHTNGDNKIFKNKGYETMGEEWNFQGSAKKLSLKRAESIKNFLVNNGIAFERIASVGYGGSVAIVKNPETMEEGQRNIRVEVKILKN